METPIVQRVEIGPGIFLSDGQRLMMASNLFEAQNILGLVGNDDAATLRMGEILRGLIADLGGYQKLLRMGA